MAAKPKPKRSNSHLFPRKPTRDEAEPVVTRDRMAKAQAEVDEWLDVLYWRQLEARRQREDLGRGGSGRGWDGGE